MSSADEKKPELTTAHVLEFKKMILTVVQENCTASVQAALFNELKLIFEQIKKKYNVG